MENTKIGDPASKQPRVFSGRCAMQCIKLPPKAVGNTCYLNSVRVATGAIYCPWLERLL